MAIESQAVQTTESVKNAMEVDVIVCSGLYQVDLAIKQPSYRATIDDLVNSGVWVLPNSILRGAGLLPEVIVGGIGTDMDDKLVSDHEKSMKTSRKASADFLKRIAAERVAKRTVRREQFQSRHPLLGRIAVFASRVRLHSVSDDKHTQPAG